MGQTENGAAIFDAHILSLEDPALIQKARQSIFGNGVNAEKAWETAVDQMINGYRSIDSSYLRARAVDLMELKASVLRILLGDEPFTFSLDKSGVVVAAELGPSDIARLEHDKVLGICTAFGGAASHGAILARALDIPAVVGIGPEILRFAQGNLLVLDGNKGSVWVDPDDVDRFRLEQKSWLKSRRVHLQKVEKPAVTRDGKRVRVAANISSVIEVETALKYGADGIGVLRTEFLFLKRSTPPSEDEQVRAYQELARRLGNRPLVIRTLDAGGDKPLPYVGARPTVNPFLGQRGIRLCLENSDLFITQLRAILRIGQGCCTKLLLPMVSTLQEIRRTKEYLRTAREELGRAGISSDQSMEIGIMIEVPSSVMLADRLAREVDFFSIGTNDLSQYIMASDRTDDRLSSLSDALGPAVLRSIQHTVMAAHESGIWVGLCGEIAGDVVAIPVLLGLGIDELSMNPLSIPDVKRVINRITMKRAEGIAKDVLDFDSAAEVRKALKARFFR
jgi:phosphocarrier protein FPr